MRRLVVGLALVLVSVSACDGGGRPAPPASAAPQGAAKLRAALDPMRGEPVVVNYWATWCEPCKVEMPRLVDAFKEYGDRVGFLGVNVEDDAEAAKSFAERYKIPFESVSDPDGKIRREEKILGLPVTQFYDADGKLAFVHQGEIKADELDERIDEVLRLG